MLDSEIDDVRSTLVDDDKPPEPDWSPPKGRYGGTLEVVYSYKMGRLVNLCFPLEYDLFLLLDCDPLVKWLCEHPHTVKMKVENRVVTAHFDMWVLWHSGKEELIEVKPQEKIDLGTSGKQIIVEEAWCKLAGIGYRYLTEKKINRQPLLDNCRQMHPYLAQHPGAE